jgi:hypothetical protein
VYCNANSFGLEQYWIFASLPGPIMGQYSSGLSKNTALAESWIFDKVSKAQNNNFSLGGLKPPSISTFVNNTKKIPEAEPLDKAKLYFRWLVHTLLPPISHQY